ncbi:hypothetical protein ACEWPL_017575 [Roseovarius sp. S1116L3]|uniref:hypothetical protein n=1 Tax=Roseovarius roseus TaxID=3342636 RepID=UPI00372C9597
MSIISRGIILRGVIFDVEREEAPTGPINTIRPAIIGTPEVGETLTVSYGTWTATGTISYQGVLRLSGVDVTHNMEGGTYTPTTEGNLTWTIVATGDEGSATANATGVSINYAAPYASGSLSDRSYTQYTGVKTVDASGDFTGAAGGTWSVTGAGASINASGVVAIPTTTLLTGAIVTVTYTNSGGAASSAFAVTIEEKLAVGSISNFTLDTNTDPIEFSVGTDTEGDIYWVITGSATAPTGAQITTELGESGAPAELAGSFFLGFGATDIGLDFSSLTSGEKYMHIVLDDGVELSNVLTSDAFEIFVVGGDGELVPDPFMENSSDFIALGFTFDNPGYSTTSDATGSLRPQRPPNVTAGVLHESVLSSV